MFRQTTPLRKLFLLGATTAVIAGSAGVASAQLYFYEGFDYTVGSDILGQSGGAGFTGPWREHSAGSVPAGSFTVGSGSLAGPAGLPSVGNHAILTGEFGTLQPARDFSEVSGADGTTTWFSYIGQRQGTTGGGTADNPYMRGVNAGVFDSTHPTRPERVGIGNSSNAATNEWSIIPEGSGGNRVGSGVPFSDLYWAVLRIDHHGDATVADDAYLFLNPDPNVEPLVGDAVASTIGAFDYSNIDFIRPFVGGQSGDVDFGILIMDDIRLGGDYASMSVVPEPTTYALLAMAGGFGLLYRRMRR